jgi:cellulose synthase/poly-beta-1,6-N-acetylglucosamine synthase-like glycosyltransferase
MGHQLNHGIKESTGELIAVYNVDSRPEPKTFSWVVEKYVNSKGNKVYQQYGDYTRNLADFERNPILVANSSWQTRWSLGLEYYRAFIASKRSWLKPFSYCVGHGLFIPRKIAERVHFSENTLNEDILFGIELAANKIDILPIPYFDVCDSPDSVKSLFHQKSVWFQGPFETPLYFRLLNKQPNKDRLLLNCAKVFFLVIYWLIGPISVLSCIILSTYLAITSSVFCLAMALAPVAYYFLPNIYARVVSKK